jgi:hypothetical protein
MASKFTRSLPPSTSANSLNDDICIRTITASKCISRSLLITASKLSQLRPSSLNQHGVQENLETSTITACKLALSRPPCSHDQGLQVRIIRASKFASSEPPSFHIQGLQVRMMMASKCNSQPAGSQSLSASVSSLDHSLQVYLQIRWVTDSMCISKLAQIRPQSVSISSLNGHFQVHLKSLSITACCQSRYTMCRWVAI